MTAPDGDTALFVLTCRKSPPNRLDHALAQAGVIGLPPAIIDGAVAEDPAVDALFDEGRARLLSKRPPARVGIAACATHRMAWAALLAGPWRQALVLEDDGQVVDPGRVRAAIAAAGALLADGRHLVKLFDFPRRRARHLAVTRTVAGIELVKWQRPRAGLVAYLISRDGAARLLARGRVFRVVDEDIKYAWEFGLDVWSIPGNPVVEASAALGGSLIEASRLATRRPSAWRSAKGIVLNLHRDWMTRRHFRRSIARAGLVPRWIDDVAAERNDR